jgi:uncharacterized membrane protein
MRDTLRGGKTLRPGLVPLLGMLSLFCLALTLIRWQATGSRLFLFLNWNLFLAAVPYLLGSAAVRHPRLRSSRLGLFLLLPAWLLFLPNAPYIVTDFVHLEARAGVPLWYDLVLILAFAWTGLVFGFASLMDVERLLAARFGRKAAALAIAMVLFLSAFGVYLGRFLRWNSWDILHRPGELLGDILDRLANPLSHPLAWGMTLVFGLLLNLMFLTFRRLQSTRLPEGST